MKRNDPLRFWSAVLCTFLLTAVPVFAEETITCMSTGNRYNYCSIRTDNSVRLVRQISHTRCDQYNNWGYDRNGVWVDRGCSAEFRIGRGHGGGGKDKDVAVAAGAVAGIALIAALASKNKNHDSEEVASWAVGSFSGYDDQERTTVEITILPGGSVRGFADGNDFTGKLDGTRLEAGRHRFTIQRSGNGFDATDERDSRHRVMFRRSGSGY